MKLYDWFWLYLCIFGKILILILYKNVVVCSLSQSLCRSIYPIVYLLIFCVAYLLLCLSLLSGFYISVCIPIVTHCLFSLFLRDLKLDFYYPSAVLYVWLLYLYTVSSWTLVSLPYQP